MPREMSVNIWSLSPKTWRCITTNGTVKNGQLIMGKGVALEAKKLHPNITYAIGDFVTRWGNICMVLDDYYLITFPTKNMWWERSNKDLIYKSALQLIEFLDSGRVIAPVYLPFPGIGAGGLQKRHVRKLLEPILDDRVILTTI